MKIGSDVDPRALVVGMAVTGTALARRLVADGFDVTVVDDSPNDEMKLRADQCGARFVGSPTVGELHRLAAQADLVIASPGVRPTHPIFAAGVEVIGEVELAASRTGAAMVAITGTSGKTTVTTLVTDMLISSGVKAVAAGNIGRPLIEAAEIDCDVLVVEVSSFQLSLTRTFHPRVAVWLNVAENHLDWHPDMEDYLAAKNKVWANLGPGDTMVANAEDAAVMQRAKAAARANSAKLVTFGVEQGDYSVIDGHLQGPGVGPIMALDRLGRSRPHDVANALAALAAGGAVGASAGAGAEVLARFGGLPHRLESLGHWSGIEFFDDSKATTPSAAASAIAGFSSVVLIAGGRNKGVSLAPMRRQAAHIRGVVAIGEASNEIEDIFAGATPVVVADSMDDAVGRAAKLARPGDAVLLSPGCASYDWYSSYEERGDAFKRAVADLVQPVTEEQ